MKNYLFYQHGEYTNPHIALLEQELQSKVQNEATTYAKGTNASTLSSNSISGVLEKFDKHVSATWNPQALGWIKAVYSNAIEYTSVIKEQKGTPFFFGILFLLLPAVTIFAAASLILPIFAEGSNEPIWFTAFCILLGSIFFFGGALAGAYLFFKFMRIDLYGLTDLPIVFDRKHRKVYRIQQEQPPGFWANFKRWPIVICEYDWDLIDVMHEADIYTTGASINRNHYLVFAVRKSREDPSYINNFQIANAATLGSDLVENVWEHIRRFMEEDGPHLPSNDEPLARMEPPENWWESMGDVGPFGPKYRYWWTHSPGITLFYHLIFPLTLPMFLFWGTGNWLSYQTAIPVTWPQPILDRLGPAIKGGYAYMPTDRKPLGFPYVSVVLAVCAVIAAATGFTASIASKPVIPWFSAFIALIALSILWEVARTFGRAKTTVRTGSVI